ncbi:unnamed protein product [marine sediment metagenome]|uniref:tRNA nucleotidyltransferase/poly(A) polymerase RNA and SrmB- binding domain-containing protein n=1 Tax=marine sediment metagenome TaxID=412755 RepID=X0ZFJ7_9ZZZZ
MDKATEDFLKKAIDDKLLSRLRKKRIAEELILILKEENPLKSLKRLEELGALKYILPEVELDEDTVERFNKVKDNYNFWKRNISDEKIELWMIRAGSSTKLKLYKTLIIPMRKSFCPPKKSINFKMDKATEDFLKKAIDDKLLSRLRKKRIAEELILILKEENPLKSLKRLEELGALKYILPEVELDEDTVERFNKVKDNYNFWKRNISDEKIELWMIYFCCLIKNLEQSQYREFQKS